MSGRSVQRTLERALCKYCTGRTTVFCFQWLYSLVSSRFGHPHFRHTKYLGQIERRSLYREPVLANNQCFGPSLELPKFAPQMLVFHYIGTVISGDVPGRPFSRIQWTRSKAPTSPPAQPAPSSNLGPWPRLRGHSGLRIF